jgi:hypothetical protein
MKHLVIVALLAFSTSACTAQKEDTLILSLQNMVGEKIISRIELFANDIDPNSRSVDDVFRLEINGKAVDVPKRLLSKLDYSRRLYSYNHYTNGIKSFVSGGRCKVGGKPVGSILQVRYLTYKGYKIVKDEMKSVYSENGNCLFKKGFAPNKAKAEKSAAKAMVELRTIMVLLAK